MRSIVVILLFTTSVSFAQNLDVKALFEQKCALCHGASGQGDGRLSILIKTPPPANFTKSSLNRESIEQMILYGGEVNGRSSSMPAWSREFDEKEVSLLVDYVYQFRHLK